MSEARWPNLFIIGAPKCGTTAMSHYLAGHPQVFMTERAGIKEPCFFCTDLIASHITWRIRDEVGYLGLFENADPHAKYWGEASPTYLYSKRAIRRILEKCRTPRFIVMVRNPIELAHSLHNEHWKSFQEHEHFETCWRWQQSRLDGEHLPEQFSDGVCLQYGRIAKMGEQLERLFTEVDRAQVHVILYDDLNADTAATYHDTLAWLELPPDRQDRFAKLNPSVTYRWLALEKGLRHVRTLRQSLGLPGGLGLHALIDRYNKTNVREPLRPDFRRELCGYFREDVALQSRLLGRDLSHWLA